MRTTKRLIFVAGTIALACLTSAPSHASCNSVAPSSAVSGLIAEPVEGQKILDSLDHLKLNYRGALGRMQEAFLVPATTHYLEFGPDFGCEEPSFSKALAEMTTPSPGAIVTAVMVSAESASPDQPRTTHIKLFGNPDVCASVRQAILAATTASANGNSIFVFPTCSTAGVQVAGNPAGRNWRMRTPYISQADLDQAGLEELVGRVTILSYGVGGEGEFLQVIGKALQGQTCTDQRDSLLASPRSLLCIDQLYEDIVDFAMPENRCEFRAGMLSITSCWTTSLPAPNDYLDLCLTPEVPTGSDLQKCKKNRNPNLKIARGECGALLVPFDWSGVRTKTDGVTKVTRELNGASAVGRTDKPSFGGLESIPGREFIASTRINGKGDPRKPEVDLEDKTMTSPVFALAGTADDDESVLHFYPQLEVGMVCKSSSPEEACYAIGKFDPNKDSVLCACEDRHMAGCKCEASTHGDRLFVCTGDHAGKPCTRPDHCPNGACNGEPKCQVADTVWPDQAEVGNKLCFEHDACPTGQQCGATLFSFVGRSKKIRVKPDNNDGRGACEHDDKKVCYLKGNAKPCASGDGTCYGFALYATGFVP